MKQREQRVVGARPRVLVLATSCNPEWESIPLVGWSHYNALREVADTHLVTRNWNRDALNRQGLVEGRDYTAFNTDALFNPVQWLVRRISGDNKGYAMLTGLAIPSYLLLEALAWRRFRADLRAGRFDLVHRITPLSPAMPSPFAASCGRAGIPFVLGPLNGGLPWPRQFPELQRQEREFLSRIRFLFRYVPGYAATRQSAAAILYGGASILAELPQRWHAKAIYVPENGIEPARFPRPAPRSPESYQGRPLRAVFLGRLVPLKGVDMVLDAATELLRQGRMQLEIIGFGPEQSRLEAMVAERGLGAAVRFAGKLPHTEVGARLREADVLTFASVRDFGGAVVLEAMAAGVVPIVVQYGGPGELVSPASGFPVPLGDRAAVVGGLRAVLDRIVADPAQLAAISERAVARAFGLFAWPAKARQVLEVYRWVLGERATKPDNPVPLPDPA